MSCKKRIPIAIVRKQIRVLESELTMEIIARLAACGPNTPQSKKQINLEKRLAYLKSTYPNWKSNQIRE